MTFNDSNDTRKRQKTAYDAFAAVDDSVSKPVFGSDAAASWQNFKNENGVVSRNVAPQVPLKRGDKLGTGFQNIEEERSHEENIRKLNGHATIGAGYQHFKKNKEDNDQHDKDVVIKRKSLSHQTVDEDPMQNGKLAIDFRERPDGATYFIPSETFTGWKKDYIFSTRHRGAGYYWDGMDTVKDIHGLSLPVDNENNSKDNHQPQPKEKRKEESKKKKKEKSKVIDKPDPFQQVADAIARRNASLNNKFNSPEIDLSESIDLKALVAAGWSVAHDSTTGRRYFFHNDTRQTVWENPLSKKKNEVIGSTASENAKLAAAGWSTAVTKEGKIYYYSRQTNETRWDNPLK